MCDTCSLASAADRAAVSSASSAPPDAAAAAVLTLALAGAGALCNINKQQANCQADREMTQECPSVKLMPTSWFQNLDCTAHLGLQLLL